MFAQGEFAEHLQGNTLTYPEKAAQKHHRRDGAQYADTILITLGGIPLTERFYQPRQAHGDQESCHAA